MINIRKADLSDVKQFAYIKAEAYADDRIKNKPDKDNIPEWYDGEWYKGLCVVDEKEAERLIRNYSCHMIMLDGKPMGIFWLMKENDDSLTIEDFCILPKFQGKGYGAEVLDLIEDFYPQNKIWTLDTPAFCKRNRHLYEKAGYKNIGTCSNDTVILYKKCID